jgi:hypothetical protein
MLSSGNKTTGKSFVSVHYMTKFVESPDSFSFAVRLQKSFFSDSFLLREKKVFV